MLAKRLAVALGLLLTSAAKAEAAHEMQPLTLNGYQIVDAQYWSFIGDAPFRYPQDVLWGFYADGASAAAQDCAVQAFRKLKTLFQSNPASLSHFVNLGGTPRFYLWISDYTVASAKRQRRDARLWHYSTTGSGVEDYTTGSWEWEATVLQSGTCQLPSDADTQATIDAAVSALGG